MSEYTTTTAEPRQHGPAAGAPELVFGLVGAVGTDLDAVVQHLESALDEVNYRYDDEPIQRRSIIQKAVEDGEIDLELDADTQPESFPLARFAWILYSLKQPKEVKLLRRTVESCNIEFPFPNWNESRSAGQS